MRADEREERRYGRAAFEVDDIRIATAQDARLDVALGHQATSPSASPSFSTVISKWKSPRGLGDEPAAQKRAAKIRRFATRLFDQMLVDAHLQP